MLLWKRDALRRPLGFAAAAAAEVGRMDPSVAPVMSVNHLEHPGEVSELQEWSPAHQTDSRRAAEVDQVGPTAAELRRRQ